MNIKKSILAAAIAAVSTQPLAMSFQDFIDESDISIKIRTAGVKINPNNVEYNNEYTPELAANLVALNGQLGTFAPFGITTPAQLTALFSGALDGALPPGVTGAALLAQTAESLDSAAEEGAEEAGSLDQSGTGIWFQIESPYFADMIGFDFGFQNLVPHHNDETGTLYFDPKDEDGGYSRVATARIKAKYGTEDAFVSAKYGRYSDIDEKDYLMDETDEGWEVSGHWKFAKAYYEVVTAQADKRTSDLTDVGEGFDHDSIDKLGFALEGKYGAFDLHQEVEEDFRYTIKSTGKSGLPLSMLGLSTENPMDYLLVGQFEYNQEKAEDDFVNPYGLADDDHEATFYEVLLGLKLKNFFLGTSYGKTSREGYFGDTDGILLKRFFINDYDLPNQTTTTWVARYRAEDFNLPGLYFSVIHFDARGVDKDQALENGNLAYWLTGDENFEETLYNIEYTFGTEENGLKLRTTFGDESNQANVSGIGFWVEYNKSF